MKKRHVGRLIWQAIPLDENEAATLRQIADRSGIGPAVVQQYLLRWLRKGVVGAKPDPTDSRRLQRWRKQSEYVSVYLRPDRLLKQLPRAR